jgi:NAD(P)-dependent dehydrogenase (short-subunit alcohol dehydrogenase family)
MNFKDRVVLITGAGSGLGRQLALDLEKEGCRIAMGDYDEKGLMETAALLETPEANLFCLKSDVTEPEDCQRLVEGTIEKFGKLDIFIPCAGASMWADFLEIKDLSLFRKMLDINYLGVVYNLHYALPHLIRSRGSLVTISSFQGVFGIAHHTAYSASKHALNGFLEALEAELGDGIHILNVMPAWISGTNLRQNAYQASGDQGGKTRKHSRPIATVTVEDCSRSIIKAIKKRKRELFQPRKAALLRIINALFPWFVSAFIRYHVKKQHKEK